MTPSTFLTLPQAGRADPALQATTWREARRRFAPAHPRQTERAHGMQRPRAWKGGWIVRALLVALVMSSLAGCGRKAARLAAERARVEAAASAASAAEAASAAAAAAEEARAEAKRIEGYKLQVTRQLKDPDSARFQNMRLVHGDGGEALCGEVNSKNGFGGYVGFTRFVVTERPLFKDGETVRVFGLEGGILEVVDALIGDESGCWPKKS